MPVVAAGEVADLALIRTHEIVTHMLAGRPDVLAAMAKNGTRLIIIGKDQVYTDMPEYRNHPDPAYQNERVRGTGGWTSPASARRTCSTCRSTATTTRASPSTSSATPSTRALGRIDPDWRERLQRHVSRAPSPRGSGRTPTPARNPAEYWAEICQSYFDCNRINNWNHGPIGTREQLKQYDPDGYELVRTTFSLTPENDWRYTPAAHAAERRFRRRPGSRSTRITRSSPGPASSP